jgi:probable F420-dependent oxidoreductase
MAFAAAATSTLRIGCRVFSIDYRRPAVLAKEAATLDLLSDGRLELGLGAGWWEGEYKAVGIPFDPPGKRIARLEHTVEALKEYFSGNELDVDNGSVAMTGFVGTPPVRQLPHPPFLIGGGGRKVLGVAGRMADIVSININLRSATVGVDGARSSTADVFAEKVTWVQEAAGQRFADLELEAGVPYVAITDDAQRHYDELERTLELTREEATEYPRALIGTVDSVGDQLRERRERYGVSYISIFESAAEQFAPVVAALNGT